MNAFSRSLLASVSFAALISCAAFSAQAEGVSPLTHTRAQSVSEPLLQLAQKTDDEEGKKFRKGLGEGKGKDRKDGPPAKKPDANAARQKALEAKQDAAKARQEAVKARQEAVKAKQDAAKAKAAKAQDDALKARKNAVKAKQDAAKAAADAKRANADRERANAVKAKQDADARRLQAIKDKQDAVKAVQDAKKAKAERDRTNALKSKQDAENLRLKFAKDKQDAARAAANAQKAKADAAAKAKALKAKREADAERAKGFKAKQAAERRAKGLSAKFDRSRADQEFDRARNKAQSKSGGRDERWAPGAAKKFETLRKERKTREVGSRNIIIEPDKRVIVRNDYGSFIRHDESARIARKRKEIRRERRKDGLIAVVTAGLAGALIYSLQDEDGRVVRRSRRDQDGREYVFFDDTPAYHDGYGRYDDGAYRDSYIDLPPPVIRIPHNRYIVEYDRASQDDIYDALNAPPVEDLDRGYTLDEVRQNYRILERMRRVDLDTINFEFASWDVPPEQYSKLERLARAMNRVLERSPDEVFLIEGHTDAVGDDVDNLSLSDRRAESVAIILTDTFGIPPENLVTQGYGEEYLKEQTDEPSWVNRRVSVRRISPLLARDDNYDDYSSR